MFLLLTAVDGRPSRNSSLRLTRPCLKTSYKWSPCMVLHRQKQLEAERGSAELSRTFSHCWTNKAINDRCVVARDGRSTTYGCHQYANAAAGGPPRGVVGAGGGVSTEEGLCRQSDH
ncbi:hypothetical protein EVAR_102119_1 [Eumeta japonica]|uniref:Uncharacterized protein n=1 Tax=Eumeta variegata TaxID=151549 RepID=A0A4C1TZQ2_EUMVA|nr:hypothetical protein EVAR_102119_1 [Eumeta japonica]